MVSVTNKEMIYHYRIKLSQINEELEELEKMLEKVLILREQGWHGKAAQKAENILKQSKQRLLRTQDSICYALQIINKIADEIESI